MSAIPSTHPALLTLFISLVELKALLQRARKIPNNQWLSHAFGSDIEDIRGMFRCGRRKKESATPGKPVRRCKGDRSPVPLPRL
jgi:hypothetical protein